MIYYRMSSVIRLFFNNCQDIALRQNQIILPAMFDFHSAVFAEKNRISDFDRHRNKILTVAPARSDSDNFSLLGFFFCGIRYINGSDFFSFLLQVIQ